MPWYLIRHNSRGKIVWNMTTNIIYMVSFFTTSYTLAFALEPLKDTYGYEMIYDIIMLCDIMLEFFTTSEKELISLPKIAKSYMM